MLDNPVFAFLQRNQGGLTLVKGIDEINISPCHVLNAIDLRTVSLLTC